MRKRVFSIILALALCLSLLPVSALAANYGKEVLSSADMVIYNSLKAQITEVANGTRSSTSFSVGSTSNMQNIVRVLMVDCPYELYWYDKTDGYTYTRSGTSGTIKFPVVAAYRGSEYATYATDLEKTTAAATVAQEAQRVVNENAGKSDYEKLLAYMTYIREQVSYDSEAAAAGGYGDPWQLVYVFDKNPDTNVVCEGYSKAFQYLCDLTTFDDPSIVCYTVEGTSMASHWGFESSGLHMWNIVSIDGQNYLVDVTNGRFLDGTRDSNGQFNSTENYDYQWTSTDGYHVVAYRYSDTAHSLYDSSKNHVLTLASESYAPPAPSLIDATVSPNAVIYGNAWSVTVKMNGTALTEGVDYTVSYSKDGVPVDEPRDVGTYRMTVTAIGDDYIGTKTMDFQILPKSISATINGSATKEYDGNTNCTGEGLSIQLSGMVPGDEVSAAATYSYDTAAVGKGKTITASDITLTGAASGNYSLATPSATAATGTITAREITVSVAQIPDQVYSGSAVTPDVEVSAEGLVGGDTLTENQDYTVAFTDNNAVGTATVTVSPVDTSNYTFEAVSQTFQITAPPLSGTYVTLDLPAGGYTYDGTAKEPGVTVTMGDTTLEADTDYTVTYSNNINAGTATVTVEGMGSYSGQATATFSIAPKEVSVIGATAEDRTYQKDNRDVKIQSVTFDGGITGETVAYSASGTMEDADAGENKTVTVTVTLSDPNYTLTDSTYTYQTTVNIAKADAPVLAGQTVYARYSAAGEQTASLQGLMPGDAGTLTYTAGTETGSSILTDWSVTDGTVAYTLASELTDEDVGKTAALPVTIGSTNYEDTTFTVTVELVDKTPVTITGVEAVEAQDGTYNGSAQTGYTGTPSSDYSGTYVYTYSQRDGTPLSGAPTDAGNYTVTIAVPDSNETYTGSTSLHFTISPKPVTITGVQAVNRDYDPDSTTVTLTGGELQDTVAGDDVNFNLGTGTIEDANAGTGKAVTITGIALTGSDAGNYVLIQPTGVTVTINQIAPDVTAPSGITAVFGQTLAEAVIGTKGTGEGSWAWQDAAAPAGDVGTNDHTMVFTPTDATNYNTVTASVSVTVSKAPGKNLTRTASVLYNAAGEQTVSLQGLMPSDAGALTYTDWTKTDENNVIADWSVTDGTVTYTLADGLTAADVGKTAALQVTVESDNYETSTVTVTITLVNKTPVTITGVEAQDGTYNGSAQTGYTGTPSSEYNGPYEITYSQNDTALSGAPTDAGSYTVTIAVPDSDETYTGSISLNFTIAKATITVRADNKSAYVNAAVPTLTYTVTGLAAGDTLAVQPTLTCDADMSKTGSYPITASGAEVPSTDNYEAEIVYVDGTLTVRTRSSESTSTADKTDKTENEDVPCDGGRDCPSRAFSDLDSSKWYHEAVDYAIENGLMSGFTDGTFKPNGTLTRAMLAQILYNLEDQPAVSGSSGFTDVKDTDWYAKAVTWAARNGLVTGYTNGTFGPEDPITREQLAVILWRYAGSPKATGTLRFTDADQVSEYAVEAMLWATQNGVINGSNGRLNPKGNATRAEVAQMLMNFIRKTEE